MTDDTYSWDNDREQEMEQDASADDCVMCGGPLQLLGSLGSRAHYRCRGCGMECSRALVSPVALSTDDGVLQPF